MKVVAFVVGLLGSVAAFLVAVLAGIVGGLGGALHTNGSHTVLALGVSAWGASVLGLVGACLVWRYPTAAWICMLIATAWTVISVSAAGIPGGVLLFVGAVFAFFSARQRRSGASPEVTL